MSSHVSLRLVLESVADLDRAGGASLALVAWDVCEEEPVVVETWERAIAEGLLRPNGRDATHDEHLLRLTASGWAALDEPRPATAC